MRRDLVTRRLPLAALVALAALLTGATLPSSVPAAAVAATHATVGSGHVADALMAAAHGRTVTHLPAAVPAGTPSSRDHSPASTTTTAPPSLRPPTATPPTAIRGPPA